MSAGRDETQQPGSVHPSTKKSGLRVGGEPQGTVHVGIRSSVLSARPSVAPPNDDDLYADVPCTD